MLDRQLQVMDLTAVTLCRDNKLPLLVFDMTVAGNIRKAVCGRGHRERRSRETRATALTAPYPMD